MTWAKAKTKGKNRKQNKTTKINRDPSYLIFHGQLTSRITTDTEKEGEN